MLPFPYEIVRKLADGGPAEVFLARPAGGGGEVVLKVMRSALASDETAVGRFLDEAAVCRRLEHPNVVRHLDAGRLPDGRVYLVTEYLEGEDLETRLRQQGPIEPAALVRLAGPLCEALDYVHSHGVVHRDLKPDNVFLAGGLEAFRPKLLDFGLAGFAGPKSVRTATGVTVATPEYMPPECIDGKKADARSDLYSLGVLFYEALTGSPPFVSPNYGELLLKHLHEEPRPLPSRCAHLSPAIRRCLAKNPADRFARASEVAAALAAGVPVILAGTLVSSHGGAEGAPLCAGEGPLEGEVLGPYRVVRVIGEGAMGKVLLARHTRLGRQVAIKLLKPEHAGNKELVQRFFQEARSVNAINHEHIVEIFDFVEELEPGTGRPRIYCVMELLAGVSLSQLLRDEKLSIRRVAAIAGQICGALEAAHRVGVVHRDIKPDNIFLTQRSGMLDFVKVLDFGVAKLTAALEDAPKLGTMAGTIIGTPTYMSPEQACGAGADARSDIYAVGVVLYELLTGRVPFEAEAFPKLVVQILTQQPPPLGETSLAGEPIPPALSSLVLSCLEKQPENRPASMTLVAAALASAASGERSIPLTVPAGHLPRRRRRGYLAAGALVVALGIGGLIAAKSAEPQAIAAPPAVSPPVKVAVTSQPDSGVAPRADELPAKIERPAPERR
ncbi:MAG: serine/threonine-protein kinase, partial [Myxococcaceae bacterium]